MKRALGMATVSLLMVSAIGCSQISDLFKEKKEEPLTAQQKVRLGMGTTGQADETVAMHGLRAIVSAQATYNLANPDKGFACSLDALGAGNFIDSELASGSKGGYRFELSCDGAPPAMRYRASAEPMNPGSQTFCVTESGSIKTTLGPASRCF